MKKILITTLLLSLLLFTISSAFADKEQVTNIDPVLVTSENLTQTAMASQTADEENDEPTETPEAESTDEPVTDVEADLISQEEGTTELSENPSEMPAPDLMGTAVQETNEPDTVAGATTAAVALAAVSAKTEAAIAEAQPAPNETPTPDWAGTAVQETNVAVGVKTALAETAAAETAQTATAAEIAVVETQTAAAEKAAAETAQAEAATAEAQVAAMRATQTAHVIGTAEAEATTTAEAEAIGTAEAEATEMAAQLTATREAKSWIGKTFDDHGSAILIAVCVMVAAAAVLLFISLHRKKPAKPSAGGRAAAGRDVPRSMPTPAPIAADPETPAGGMTITTDAVPLDSTAATVTTAVISRSGPYIAAGCIGQGKRDYQEDSYWIYPESRVGMPFCAVVADGMGGMENGAESSTRAVEKVKAVFPQIKPDKDIPSRLWELSSAVNSEVYTVNTMKSMNGGCTFICVYIYLNRLFWISIGDSRIYLIRDGILNAVNEEHELESRLYAKVLDGDISLEDVRDIAERELRKLTSNIGRETIPLIDQNFIPYKLRQGDKLLLCSDGVSGTLSDAEILECMNSSSPEICTEQIAEMIEMKNKRGQDNYSAVVIYCATEEG